jgi:hypothetical protein
MSSHNQFHALHPGDLDLLTSGNRFHADGIPDLASAEDLHSACSILYHLSHPSNHTFGARRHGTARVPQDHPIKNRGHKKNWKVQHQRLTDRHKSKKR